MKGIFESVENLNFNEFKIQCTQASTINITNVNRFSKKFQLAKNTRQRNMTNFVNFIIKYKQIRNF